MSEDKLTRAERSDLQKVARMRARVARNGIDALKAERLMQFEQDLAARYDFDDAAWSELTSDAQRYATMTAGVHHTCEWVAVCGCGERITAASQAAVTKLLNAHHATRDYDALDLFEEAGAG